MFIMFFYIILWRSISLSLAYEDPYIGRCTRNVTNIEGKVYQEHYCCRHYVKQNNECVECAVGFTSDDGLTCIKCKDGYYGRRCAEPCQCDVNRCDNIQGCLHKHVSTIETTIYSRKQTEAVTGLLTHENGSRSNENKETRVTDETKTFVMKSCVKIIKSEYISAPTRQTTLTDAETGRSQLDLLVYSVTVNGFIGIILILGLCYFGRRYNRKNSRNKISLAREDLTNSTDEVIELNNGIYHSIDENNMVDLNTNTNLYLEVVDSSTNSDSISSTNEDASGYRHSYNSLIAETEIDTYEKCRSDSQMSKHPSVTDEAKKGDDDYNSPCQSFSDISECDWNDENKTTIVVVHRSETSSSESDTDEHACSGYLSPLPDNEDVYDISVSGLVQETESEIKKYGIDGNLI